MNTHVHTPIDQKPSESTALCSQTDRAPSAEACILQYFRFAGLSADPRGEAHARAFIRTVIVTEMLRLGLEDAFRLRLLAGVLSAILDEEGHRLSSGLRTRAESALAAWLIDATS